MYQIGSCSDEHDPGPRQLVLSQALQQKEVSSQVPPTTGMQHDFDRPGVPAPVSAVRALGRGNSSSCEMQAQHHAEYRESPPGRIRIGTTFTGPLKEDNGDGHTHPNGNHARRHPGSGRMTKSRSAHSVGSLGANVEGSGPEEKRRGSMGARSLSARSVGSFRSLLSSLGGKSDVDDMDSDDDDSSMSSFEGGRPKSDSSLSSGDDDMELPFDNSRRRRRTRSGSGSVGRIASGRSTPTAMSSGKPSRRRSTGHLSLGADPIMTSARRRRGMKKNLSDSHVTTALELDDDDIDYVVQLKMMVAEAKSEADAASVHISHLTKQNRHLQQINAHLQERVINGSSRIAELESELQRYKNQKSVAARRGSKAGDAAAGGGAGGDNTTRPMAAAAPAAPLIAGSDLAMSDLKFRVAELERQNRNLRSKLKGAGKK